STRAMFIAPSSDVAFPVSLADSIAVVTSTRATTARRKSSADGPSSLTKAPTSQDDIRIRAPPIFTVVIDLPREGGVAIDCSQLCSMQVSKSSAATGPVPFVVDTPPGSLDFAFPLGASGSRTAFLSEGTASLPIGTRVEECWGWGSRLLFRVLAQRQCAIREAAQT